MVLQNKEERKCSDLVCSLAHIHTANPLAKQKMTDYKSTKIKWNKNVPLHPPTNNGSIP